MAEETTPKDITPIKRKGIDMAVKGLKKPYPFILGYQDETTTNFRASHYIDLIIDNDKLGEYMGVKVNPYWEPYVKDRPEAEKIYTMWSYLLFPNEDTFGDITNHPGYILSEEIKDDLQIIYENLPDEYRLFYEQESTYQPGKIFTYPVHLRVNGYFMT